MKVCYDLHIHSCLSPCADDDMTPINIVARASAEGLEMIAVSDHNSILNVEASIEVGRVLGVTVVPAIELQTIEDIHILCLFDSYENLKNFYQNIEFFDIKNDTKLYGNQLIVDTDDIVLGKEERLLCAPSKIKETEVLALCKKHNGIAIPAHIDRDANGMIAILGGIPSYYNVVELSSKCDSETKEEYKKIYRVICDSDSHSLDTIGSNKQLIDIKENSVKALLSYLNGD